MLGYNRRNLETLKIEDESENAYDFLKIGLPLVLESGISLENVEALPIKKYDGLLIGTALLSGEGLINKIASGKND